MAVRKKKLDKDNKECIGCRMARFEKNFGLLSGWSNEWLYEMKKLDNSQG
jgi:hypothetical protein